MDKLKIFLLLLFLSSSFFAYSQQRQIEMEYDAAGNRKHLIVVTLPTKSRAAQNSSPQEETTGFTNEWVGKRKIRIYPNPTKGALRICIVGNSLDNQVPLRLFNSNATLLTQKNWDGQETLLDLSNFPSGIYILSILIEGINKEFKVVKE